MRGCRCRVLWRPACGLQRVLTARAPGRHKRMNAVRIRKENQVYTAEEKRALALFSFEERQQKENKVLSEFRTLIAQRMKEHDLDAEELQAKAEAAAAAATSAAQQ